MIVIIDNYDSFTYNLYQAVAVYAQDVIVLRNDAVDASMLQKLKPTALVFSPGAGHPHAAGNMESIIQQCYRDIPMLGICLGHQAIAEVFSSRSTVSAMQSRKQHPARCSMVFPPHFWQPAIILWLLNSRVRSSS